MFKTILTALQDLLGFYILNDRREFAIAEDYAIDRDVFGLEVVVIDTYTNTTRYPGGAVSKEYTVRVYLTQHEGGNNTLTDAIARLETLGYEVSTRRYVIGKQGNVRRAVVSITTNCIC